MCVMASERVRSIAVLALAAASLSATTPVLARGDLLSRYAHWEERLRQRVNSLLVYPEGMQSGEGGDVLVSFMLGADGRPHRITIQQSSGEPIFDRAAVRLVSDLGKIGQVPSDAPAIDKVTLKLSYGEPCERIRDCGRLAEADARERLANEAHNRSIVSATRVAEGK
jgi:TonB family protein